MPFFDYYQSTETPGYLFIWISSGIMAAFSLVWIAFVTRKRNHKYVYSPPMSQALAFKALVLTWRIAGVAFTGYTLYNTFSQEPSSTPLSLYYSDPLKPNFEDHHGTGILEKLMEFISLMPLKPDDKQQIDSFLELLERFFYYHQRLDLTNKSSPTLSLTYFTNWNFILISLYYVVSLLVSLIRILAPDIVPHIAKASPGAPYKRTSGPSLSKRSLGVHTLFTAQQVIGEIALPTAFFITLFVWSYLVPHDPSTLAPFVLNPNGYETGMPITFGEVAVHGMNLVLMFGDMLLAGYRFNPTHFVLPMLWGSIYSMFSLVMNAKYGMICYSVMRTDYIESIYFFAATVITILAAFFSLWFFSKLKRDGWNLKTRVFAFFTQPCDNAQVDILHSEKFPDSGTDRVGLGSAAAKQQSLEGPETPALV